MLFQMAVITEQSRVVAASALGNFTFGIETVGKLIIQIVSPGRDVVASVTFDAVCFLAVTLRAPLLVDCCALRMIVPPPGRMDISQRDILSMAYLTFVRRLLAVVAVQTRLHARHIGPCELSRLDYSRMASLTV